MINNAKKICNFILNKVSKEINSTSLKEEFRVSSKDFTRDRIQSFSGTIMLVMNRLTKSLCIEIESFVTLIQRDCGLKSFVSFTKSAFVQCRKKIKPEVFKKINNLLVEEFYTDNQLGVKLWKGFRVLAIDGSTINLPQNEELKNIYGIAKNQTGVGVVQAKASVFYDVLNNMIIDGILSPNNIGERTLALKHLDKSQGKDLIIYDRGYPSFDFIQEHCIRSIDYLMRTKISFNATTISFVESGKPTQIIEIYPNKNASKSDKSNDTQTPIKARLIRVDLPSGEAEVLITSLLDTKQYPNKIFKDLYFKRWKVETFYDELKNKLKIENFSGYSDSTILQDFYAALIVSNVQSLIVKDLEDEIKEETKDRKLEYKVNSNLSYGFLKDRIISLFFSNKNTDDVVNELKILFKKNLVPIRPDRSYCRNTRKYCRRVKPKVTKNQKDAL